MNEYQSEACTTAVYPQAKGLEYTALGLAGEAGEIANKVKKVLRDGASAYDPDALANELGDVLWYVAMFAEELGIDLDDIAVLNLSKLKSRQKRGVLKGAGDNR
jgi:NTP pyrophosphatase (non-canonical NTP hydrolase)